MPKSRLPPIASLRDLGNMNGTHINFSKPVSDVWSFAACLYQLLTGKFPYRFDPKRDPIDIILNENPVPIRDRMPGWKKSSPPSSTKPSSGTPKTASPTPGNCSRPSQNQDHDPVIRRQGHPRAV
jgi:serine/threonine protein kinase